MSAPADADVDDDDADDDDGCSVSHVMARGRSMFLNRSPRLKLATLRSMLTG